MKVGKYFNVGIIKIKLKSIEMEDNDLKIYLYYYTKIYDMILEKTYS